MHMTVTRDAERVHRVEKEEARAAKQVLQVVLRGGDDDVDACLIHQRIEPLGIKRNGSAKRAATIGHVGLPRCPTTTIA